METSYRAGRLRDVGLDDLPRHRREALLWFHALELDYDGVDDLVRESVGDSCPWQLGSSTAPADAAAVLGDDGRYHLVVNGRPQCARRPRRYDPTGVFLHTQGCHWWTDGTRYRVQAPPDALGPSGLVSGEHGRADITWLLTLTDTRIDPVLVPMRHRCVDPSGRAEWPGYMGPNTPLGRQRAQLAATLGTRCHACRMRLGTFVDHDHFTGLVRGLLCVHCNTHIDKCPHVSGCAWADYLNKPPAAHLQLKYPKPERAGRSSRTVEKIEYLGFDPIWRGQAGRGSGRGRDPVKFDRNRVARGRA